MFYTFSMYCSQVIFEILKIIINIFYIRSLTKKKTILSVCNKIILQLNCKLGGELWKLEVLLNNFFIIIFILQFRYH